MNLKLVISLLSFTLCFFNSCKEVQSNNPIENVETNLVVDTMSIEVIDTIVISDYDMSDVASENILEFKENLVKIEKEFGVQWDFCTCIVKGDSINKAFMNPDLPDDQFDELSARFDVIDEKCKAFRIQNPSVTPEERATHERKVRKCLKEAGL